MECGSNPSCSFDVVQRLDLTRHWQSGFRLAANLVHLDDVSLSILSYNVNVPGSLGSIRSVYPVFRVGLKVTGHDVRNNLSYLSLVSCAAQLAVRVWYSLWGSPSRRYYFPARPTSSILPNKIALLLSQLHARIAHLPTQPRPPAGFGRLACNRRPATQARSFITAIDCHSTCSATAGPLAERR